MGRAGKQGKGMREGRAESSAGCSRSRTRQAPTRSATRRLSRLVNERNRRRGHAPHTRRVDWSHSLSHPPRPSFRLRHSLLASYRRRRPPPCCGACQSPQTARSSTACRRAPASTSPSSPPLPSFSAISPRANGNEQITRSSSDSLTTPALMMMVHRRRRKRQCTSLAEVVLRNIMDISLTLLMFSWRI